MHIMTPYLGGVMKDDIRINLHLPASAKPMVDRLCRERNLSRTAMIRQALGVFEVVHDATRRGHFVGVVDDYEKLHTVLLASV